MIVISLSDAHLSGLRKVGPMCGVVFKDIVKGLQLVFCDCGIAAPVSFSTVTSVNAAAIQGVKILTAMPHQMRVHM